MACKGHASMTFDTVWHNFNNSARTFCTLRHNVGRILDHSGGRSWRITTAQLDWTARRHPGLTNQILRIVEANQIGEALSETCSICQPAFGFLSQRLVGFEGCVNLIALPAARDGRHKSLWLRITSQMAAGHKPDVPTKLHLHASPCAQKENQMVGPPINRYKCSR